MEGCFFSVGCGDSDDDEHDEDGENHENDEGDANHQKYEIDDAAAAADDDDDDLVGWVQEAPLLRSLPLSFAVRLT